MRTSMDVFELRLNFSRILISEVKFTGNMNHVPSHLTLCQHDRNY